MLGQIDRWLLHVVGRVNLMVVRMVWVVVHLALWLVVDRRWRHYHLALVGSDSSGVR